MVKNRIVSVARVISRVEKNIALGYSDENFSKTAGLMSVLSQCLEPQDWRLLGDLWRDSFTDSCDSVTLNAVCKQFKQKYKNAHTKR